MYIYLLVGWPDYTHSVENILPRKSHNACQLKLRLQLIEFHNTQFTCICTAPQSLLGVLLVNVLVHMHLLIGGVGVHWYCIRSRADAGLSCNRLLPAVINGCMYVTCSSVVVLSLCKDNIPHIRSSEWCIVKLCVSSLSDCFFSFQLDCSQHYPFH